ncbi:MAG: glycosyltransferase family 4 protein [Alphaproteobacteria bacterium]|nr:glycosyltransferase family 4 protein [Alphaproteobacteria bacterium]
MATILFLASRMQFGFGVSLVIDEVSRRLIAQGHRVTVGCEHHDAAYGHLDCRVVPPDPERVRALAAEVGAKIVCAHTTPFFEVLPHLAPPLKRWAWEHGDPTPDFFPSGREERARIAENKRLHVYPAIDGVIAISHFIASDIRWPDAVVIANGADHVADFGSKGLQDVNPGPAPLGVGTLMRLGVGEGFYKGRDLFLDLVDAARADGLDAAFHVMGRGTAEDAAPFRERGVEVHLNASDEERSRYLRALDVFFSPSLWEGCNLPLLEAQATGTASIAFDTGAHPEMTPLLAEDIGDVLTLLRAMARDPGLLLNHSVDAYRFVRGTYRWDDTARSAAESLGLGSPVRAETTALAPPAAIDAVPLRGSTLVGRAGRVLVDQGMGAFVSRARRSLAYRLGRRRP